MATLATGDVAVLLDELPDLGTRLSADEFAAASRALRTHTVTMTEAPLTIPDSVRERGAYGLLVLDGWLGYRIREHGVQRLELLGPGDLIRPWVQNEDVVGPRAAPDWSVLARARLATLDRRFSLVASRWPEIGEALMHRLVLRSRRLVAQMAAAAQRNAEDRVLLALWQLAERCGTVGPEGIRISVRLTHNTVGELVGTRRPPTSAAIGRLKRQGRLDTTSDGRFVLLGDRPPL